jgi:hypothetical protein
MSERFGFIPPINSKGMQLLLAIVFIFAGCTDSGKLPPGDNANGGLFLPDQFEALVVADSTG